MNLDNLKNLRPIYQCEDAKKEAINNNVPFTSWPLDVWVLKRIRARFNESGKLANQHLICNPQIVV